MNGGRAVQQFLPNGHMPNGSSNGQEPGVASLPLNIIMLIIQYTDDIADLARMARTCRVIHYLSLPQLYRDVHLKSHADAPKHAAEDGYLQAQHGSSAFLMGLSGLTSRNYAHLVRSLTLSGEWDEEDNGTHTQRGVDGEDYTPAKSMMLSIIVRSAIDRMDNLESFTWKLNTKPLQTVYQGLALRPRLTSFTLKFPSSRSPRPIVTIPGIPTLRALKITDLDPICYPDDISLLLLQSKKLQELRMHWSPRMRRNNDHSTTLQTYFGRCIVAGYKLPVRHLAFQNMYAFNNDELERVLDPSRILSFTSFNTGPVADRATGEYHFVGQSWITRMPDIVPSIKHVRVDCIVRQQISFFKRFSTLEEVFLVNPYEVDFPTPSPSSANTPNSASPPVRPHSPFYAPAANSPWPPSNAATPKAQQQSDTHISPIGREFITVLAKNHGKNLRKVLLSPAWRFGREELMLLVRSCPSLTELALGVQVVHADLLRLLIPFLPKLRALRILDDPNNTDGGMQQCAGTLLDMELLLAGEEYANIRYLGFSDLIYEVGKPVLDETGFGLRRPVRALGRKDVEHVDIWGLDKLEI